MNRWSARMVVGLALPLLIAGLTQAGEVTAMPSLAVPTRVKQALPTSIDINLGRRALQSGDRGRDVESLQRTLDRNGLYTGAFDGVYGTETADAVEAYQLIQGLPATGQADSGTLEHMGFILPDQAATPSASLPNAGEINRIRLVPGDTGADVVALQRALNSYGLEVVVDGDYGDRTRQAVRAYQRTRDLPVTGAADRATLEDIGFDLPRYRYVAGIVAGADRLSEIQEYFPDAYLDSARQGRFINIGDFASRHPAEARSHAARARGFDARVLYRR